MNFPSNLNCDGKTVSEMGPRSIMSDGVMKKYLLDNLNNIHISKVSPQQICVQMSILTHYALAKPFGDIDLGPYWFRQWLVVLAITTKPTRQSWLSVLFTSYRTEYLNWYKSLLKV